MGLQQNYDTLVTLLLFLAMWLYESPWMGHHSSLSFILSYALLVYERHICLYCCLYAVLSLMDQSCALFFSTILFGSPGRLKAHTDQMAANTGDSLCVSSLYIGIASFRPFWSFVEPLSFGSITV